MRGRRRGPSDEWVMPRTEDLVKQEKPPLQTGMRPLPLLSHPPPRLPPPLPELDTLPEVQNPPTGGASSGENRREEEMTTDGRQEITPVERDNSPVSTPPPSPVASSFPTTIPSPQTNLLPSPASTTSTPSPLEREQRTRRPPAYLQDFVCDRVTSGRYERLAGRRRERLAAKRGSYEPHGKTKFCEGGAVGGITTLDAHSSGLAQQTCCPAFSYADAVKGGRVSIQPHPSWNVEYDLKYRVPR